MKTQTITIPSRTYGTWKVLEDTCTKAVADAIDAGYRHIDTAQLYGNEKEVGQGIALSGIAREEIFITDKIADSIKDYDSAMRSIDESLEKLNTSYIDLMLIHSPRPFDEMFNPKENKYFQENAEVYRALEDALEAGKVKAIGLSNFQIDDIENILEHCTIKPICNQILVNATHYPKELMDYMEEQGIETMAYSPNGSGRIRHELVSKLAEKYGCSPAQISGGFVAALGCILVQGSLNPAHMKENYAYSLNLEEEDLEKLKQIGQYKGWKGSDSD